MSFADLYLDRYSTKTQYIESPPNNDLKIIVIIPCFNEPNIVRTLQSLYDSKRISSSVEVIIHINSGEHVSDEIKAQNLKSFDDANAWILNHNDEQLKFHIIFTDKLPRKDAGVGLARKIAMDEASRRFNSIEKADGIIVSFDADAIVDENYFIEIEKAFKDKKAIAGAIYFEHPIDGDEFDNFTYSKIIQYELYLRYYYQALKFIGLPNIIHTVGSSFAVRAETYCKLGGMNRKKAGEDFYFLQKVVGVGKVAEINTTKVIPSPRPSDRVPFGTGAAIMKWNDENELNYETYNLQSFLEIKKLIESAEFFFRIENEKYDTILNSFHIGLKRFLLENEFAKNIEEINSNSSDLASFTKRFFNWFNMFKVLKCMNFLAQEYFEHKPIVESALELLKLKGCVAENLNSNKSVLEFYRNMEFIPLQQK